MNELRRHLLRWYRKQRRDLPWRATDDPWAIWVAEVMLQQTRVESAAPRWRSFLDTFPTVKDLAAASEEQVLAAWSGLGYYSRARSLHRAARAVVEQHAGRIPDDVDALRALPGVGPYTAGAVASIAFGRAAAAVDGNVSRVLARWRRVPGSIRSGPVQRELWRIADALLEQRDAGDWSQALIELGATLCTPRRPRCSECPVAAHCEAFEHGDVEAFPEAVRRPASERVQQVVVLLRSASGRLLFRVESDSRQLQGLWEPPTATIPPDEPPARTARKLLRELGLENCRVDTEPRLVFRHAITTRRIESALVAATAPSGTRAPRGYRWVTAAALRSAPLSRSGLTLRDSLR